MLKSVFKLVYTQWLLHVSGNHVTTLRDLKYIEVSYINGMARDYTIIRTISKL